MASTNPSSPPSQAHAKRKIEEDTPKSTATDINSQQTNNSSKRLKLQAPVPAVLPVPVPVLPPSVPNNISESKEKWQYPASILVPSAPLGTNTEAAWDSLISLSSKFACPFHIKRLRNDEEPGCYTQQLKFRGTFVTSRFPTFLSQNAKTVEQGRADLAVAVETWLKV